MRTFVGSDKRFYRNNLCFDTTNGETIASEAIRKYKMNQTERELFDLWDKILKSAKNTKNYNKLIVC